MSNDVRAEMIRNQDAAPAKPTAKKTTKKSSKPKTMTVTHGLVTITAPDTVRRSRAVRLAKEARAAFRSVAARGKWTIEFDDGKGVE